MVTSLDVKCSTVLEKSSPRKIVIALYHIFVTSFIQKIYSFKFIIKKTIALRVVIKQNRGYSTSSGLNNKSRILDKGVKQMNLFSLVRGN